ncbi:MAG: PilZ domain-containing protein [Nitrospiraceae bacterium]
MTTTRMSATVVIVRYTTADGERFHGQASGIGPDGLFIESSNPLPIGTKIIVEFALPESPLEWLEAKGVVAWICPKADQYEFSQGMGVKFVELSSTVRRRILQRLRT